MRILGEKWECSPNWQAQTTTTPNDAFYVASYLWGLSSAGPIGIDAPHAWDISTGSRDVVVGVVDTGIDYTHVDLAPNIWTNPNEIPANSIDDDHNGYIDDIHGINGITGSSDPMDDNGHGSHCSGTIGANGNDGVGVAGVNWRVSLIGAKFLGSTGNGAIADAIQGIDYLIDLKISESVNIVAINNSWAASGYSTALYDAFDRANSAGIVMVVAAGNANSNNDTTAAYPANLDLPNIVTVAATTDQGLRASFSNYGPTNVDIAAPGQGIWSSVPGGWSSYNGTSMAAPHVTGVIALMKAANPTLTMEELIASLYSGATLSTDLTATSTSGRLLNAYGAVMAASAVTPTPTPTPTLTPTPTPTPSEVDESTPTPTPVTDQTRPLVRASSSSGTYKGNMTLRYTVVETSGSTRDRIQIYRRTKIVKSITRARSAIPDNGIKVYTTSALGFKRRGYTFCVRATDSSQNASRRSCSTLTIE